MLLKRILCRTAPERREAFSQAQRAWSVLAGAEGFLGQAGGWTLGDPNEALVVGLWKGAEAYRGFMEGLHGRAFEGSGQAGTYEGLSTAVAREEIPIPGEAGGMAEALREGTFLRLTECRVPAERQAHFMAAQREVWNPGMAAAGGMLGGSFARALQEPGLFFVATFWASREAHARYVRDVFPRMCVRSGAGDDLDAIEGRRCALEEAWRVVPAP